MYQLRPILKTYYDALEEGKVLGLECQDCGHVVWRPVPTCQQCGGTNQEWCEMGGEALVDEIISAPRGAVVSDGGERPASPGRRSGRVKLAAVCPRGTLGVGGSSRDEVRSVQYCRMGRVW